MSKEILLVVDAVSNEKGVAKTVIFEAIEAARSIGEVPTRRTVKVTTRQLTSFERYERHQGRLNLPDEERKILAEVPIEATIQAKESR